VVCRLPTGPRSLIALSKNNSIARPTQTGQASRDAWPVLDVARKNLASQLQTTAGQRPGRLEGCLHRIPLANVIESMLIHAYLKPWAAARLCTQPSSPYTNIDVRPGDRVHLFERNLWAGGQNRRAAGLAGPRGRAALKRLEAVSKAKK
jgi:hypothetical protein